METPINMCFYGSLKTGHYNNPKSEGVQTTGKIVDLVGFNMYSLGAYPYIRKTPANNSIKVELFKVSQEDFEWIDRMEQGAHYTREVVDIEGTKHYIYVMKPNYCVEDRHPVESGNWEQ